MPLPQSNVYRHDRNTEGPTPLAGEVAPETIPLLCAAHELCLRDGVHNSGSDFTPVTISDCGGPDSLIQAYWGRQNPEEMTRPTGHTVLRVPALPFAEQVMARPEELRGPVRHTWTRWSG